MQVSRYPKAMRTYVLDVLAIGLVVVGCAGQPAVAPKPAVSSVQPAQPAPPGTVPTSSQDETPAQKQAHAKAMGYTLVTQNGEDLYCRTSVKTGSRLQKETVCLTTAEWEIVREQARQTFGSPMMQAPSRQGH
jgi:hypothetical protein